MKVLILGIGQSLRRDDAAGLEAVQLWQAQYPDTAMQVRVELSELPGPDILDLLEGMEAAIIVDAVQSSGSTGSVICLGPDEFSSFTPDTGSAHGWGVAETLLLGQSLYPSLAMCRVTLIGIVGKDFSIGSGLSPEVRTAMEKAADMVEMEIQKNCSNKKGGSCAASTL